MIKFNRMTEYGLIALRHMSRKQILSPQDITSAREIADTYRLPYEMTAKTLQRLKDKGLIHAEYGAKGGYTLQKPLSEISLAEFLELIEGPQAVVACTAALDVPSSAAMGAGSTEGAASVSTSGSPREPECEFDDRCEIKHMMVSLNSRIISLLSGIQLSEFASFGGADNSEVQKR